MTERPPRRLRRALAAVVVAVPLGLAACGGDDGGESGPSLPADADAGRQLARDKGCAACHGGDGEGSIGPPWVGLAGSTVTLDDGSQVVADAAYLTRAIAEPNAEIVDGYSVAMPENSLSDEEIAQLVAYITSLGGGGSTSTPGTDS